MAKPLTMANGSYPIANQSDANKAWNLRGHSKDYTEGQVVAHIRRAVKQLGLKMPSSSEKSMMARYPALPVEAVDRLRSHYQVAAVKTDTTPADPNPAGYDAETQVIARNANTTQAKQAHPFQPATYLANEDAARRCLLCGIPEPADGQCPGLDPGTAVKPVPEQPKGVEVSKLSDDEAGEAAQGVDAIVDQAVELLEALTDLPVEAKQALALLQGVDATLDNLLDYFGVEDPDDDNAEGPAETERSYQRTVVRERIPQPVLNKSQPASPGFVTELNGKTLITAQASVDPTLFEKAFTPNEHFLWTQGRLVGADEPNRNGAFWSSGDLEMGQATVKYGPLNWLHDGKHVIGTLAEAAFLNPAEQADDSPFTQPHIAVVAPVWKWLYPDEASVIEMASDAGKFWYSMECVSKSVQCVGDNGCGKELAYMDYIRGQGVCQHMAERSAVRRLVDPTFLGAAVIVPPVRPGWADANASAMTQAAALSEKAYESAGRPDVAASDWEQLMAQVVKFATA